MSSSSVRNCALIVSVLVCGLVTTVNSQNGGDNEWAKWSNCNLNVNGTCILVTRCPPALDALTRQASISKELVLTLRNLQCGWDNNQAMVCCLNMLLMPEETIPIIPKSDRNQSETIIAKYMGIGLFPNKTVCGEYKQIADRILGGELAQIYDFPWMALLSVSKGDGYRFHCGGSLINDRYVITAAHCVYGQDLNIVRLGEWNLNNETDCVYDILSKDCNDPPVDVDVEEKIVHPYYNSEDHSNDIALLRLAKQINYTEWIRPICLPFSPKLRSNEYKNEQLVISGWGRTETRQRSITKQKLRLRVEDIAICIARYKHADYKLTNKQMCAGGEPGRDSCSGDSGGPLMSVFYEESTNWYLAGITSFGPARCATEGWPGIFTRVGPYIDWILSRVKQ